MKLHQQHRRGRDDPQQLVTKVRAQHRVSRDARRIIIREPRQQPRPQHRQKRHPGTAPRFQHPGKPQADPPLKMCHRMRRRMLLPPPLLRGMSRRLRQHGHPSLNWVVCVQ